LDGCGARWIRINYMHPDHLDDGLISCIASSKTVLPYFDIPLQHASPRMLKLMGRTPNQPEAVIERFSQIREAIPDATLRTSLIAGFPGETDEDFARLVELIKTVHFDYAGIFEYSDEVGTPASRLPDKVDPNLAAERANFLNGVQSAIVAERNRERKGTRDEFIVDMLLEGAAVGRVRGQAPEVDPYTYAYDCPDGTEPGNIIPVEITSFQGYELLAEYRRDDG
jgi:ribosomal protein S12 methylthiotransferase